MGLEHLDRLEEVWKPDPATFAAAPLGRMAARYDLHDVESVYRKAAEDPNWYWQAAEQDIGLRWMQPYDEIVDMSGGVEFPRYYAGGRLNWSDYAVDKWVDLGRGDHVAVKWMGDGGERRDVTYSELHELITRAAGALRAAGVERGDSVGLLLPMVPEAAVAELAAARIGAITVPMFSGYGPPAIRERMEQSSARVLITADGFPRRGRSVPLKVNVDEALDGLDIDRVLVVDRIGRKDALTSDHDRWWHEELADATPVVHAESMDADDPCLLLFTSGSTGRPKGTVHTHAGMPFKLALEARHGMGMDETGTLLWMTDMGWVMGSFIIAAALGNGGTAAMFEGTPDWPEPDRLWSVAGELGVTLLGISPTAVRSLMRHGEDWADRHPLPDLRVIASTGEPWNVEPWMWCYRHVGKERMPIINISGGTECGGSLVCGSIHLGAKPTSFAGPTLGVSTDVVDEAGNSVRGEVGELVARAPWPGMTKSLWHDRERYLESYWQQYPGMWHQSDFAYVDPDGYWYLLGRSDDTMNVAGKRVGPAEVESVIVGNDNVVEAAAVGVPHDVKGTALMVFVVLQDGVKLADVQDELIAQARADLGPALVPSAFHQVNDLPKTRSGKVLRRLIRAKYVGEPLGDVSSLENPDALKDLPVGGYAVG